MNSSLRTTAIGLVLSAVSLFAADKAPDPSGHWVGTIESPIKTFDFQVDFARDARGELVGALRVVADDDVLIPLIKLAVDGRAITFYSRSDQPMQGVLSDDGTSISGTAVLSGYDLPFEMKRTGEGKLASPVTSPAVGKELEGTWNGALSVNGASLRVELVMMNQPDGNAIARLVSVDEGGMTLPVVVSQDASHVTWTSRGVVSSYSGTLNADRTELTGTWTEGALSLPLVFHRAAR